MHRLGFGLLVLLSLGVAAYGVVAYTLLPAGALVPPGIREAFERQVPTVYAHVFGSAVALVLGPLQFWSALRARRPGLHRLAGKLYLGIGVGLGGVAGLILATSAQGGTVGRLGFACLALTWLYTAIHALGAAQQVAVAAWSRVPAKRSGTASPERR